MAIYLYSYYLAYTNTPVAAFILALLASFMDYGSTPIAVALFILFVLDKQMKKGMILIVPNIIFAIYFVSVSILVAAAPSRVLEKLTLSRWLKQFSLQLATFIDATLGPSMWFKIYYSFFHLSLTSWLIGMMLLVALFVKYRQEIDTYNTHLLISLGVLMLCSFAMFAATGRYPQLAFNLGNRTTFWGSLFLSYVIVLLPGQKLFKVTILGILLLSALGISDHWKSWSAHQQSVIQNIRENQDLRSMAFATKIYVSGNQYSKFGPFSHIEFLSQAWVPQAIFNLTLPRHLILETINKRKSYRDGNLYDAEYQISTIVTEYIDIYDSDRDQLLKVNSDQINGFIDALPEERRHWIMLGEQGFVRWIRGWVVYLMPRLKETLK